ncbi:MAG TPA: EAL domain-containing protein [Solirubrobacteraceae bacterium]|nr:EAL domain-containing protein [Solirubrobacteraceae bacterium]
MPLLDRLPRGATLPCDAWRARHRMMVRLVWLHVAGLAIFALARGYGISHAALDVLPVALLGAVAGRASLNRRLRTAAVAIGLLTCSAMLVHLWDGAIEAHFHFFVMVTILATYEEWFPYLLAIAYVVLHHGAAGALDADSVYAHADGARNPWLWAGVHGGFVSALAVANVVSWRLNEQVRERLQSSQDRFRSAFDDAPVGMAIVGDDGLIRRGNLALAERTGWTQDELVGIELDEMVEPIGREGLERRLRHRDGTSGWALCHRSLLPADTGEEPTYIAHVIDISQRKQAERKLDHQAHHDTLTELPNRKLFERRLEEALATGDSGVGALFVDLDNFKLVNDTLGHATGDRLLQLVAERMQRLLRPEDVIARFGGDEFAVLLRGIDGVDEAVGVADRIAGALRAPFNLADEQRYVTASIGICLACDSGRDAADLLRDADSAMYRAKELGKARCEVFDDGMREIVVERVGLEASLRGAVERGELRLDYQPLIELATGRIRSVEALLRWDHPELGLIPPVRFIPVAEQSGLIGEIGAWVVRVACVQAAAWDDEIEIAVNVSPRQLASPAFREHVGAALAAAGLPPHRLCLEVTESAVIADLEEADRTLRGLRDLGVKLAVDDFGVGYASLSQLKSLPPVDVLKIDRSFVSGVLNGADDRAIVEAVVGLAHSLGLQTVAEGIETAEQGEALKALDCVFGQGYHYARPSGPDVIAELLARQAAGEPAT